MDQTLNINDYKDWTMDWALSLNGNYYSNKAPGPALVATPLFWLIDQAKRIESDTFQSNYRDLKTIGYEHKVIIPLLFQMIPLCILVMLLGQVLREEGLSAIPVLLAIVVLLFGNTSALFMTTWFGHGLTAVFILAALYFFLKKDTFLISLFIGLAISCDYSVALLAFTLPVLYKSDKWLFGRKEILRLLGGLTLPGAMLLFYHYQAFSNPFYIPNMFNNPEFNNASGSQFHIPDPLKFIQLLFGVERGVLFTQPWVLVIVGWAFVKIKSVHTITSVGILSLLLLLILNASFEGWHGGSTPGPRYLSWSFPILAIASALEYNKMNKLVRYALFAAVVYSLLFGGLVYATTILVFEHKPIIVWLINYFEINPNWLRVAFYSIGVLIAVFISTRGLRQNSVSRNSGT